jgi:uncharacterized protein
VKPLLLNVAELLRRPGSDKDVALSATPVELALDDDRLTDDPVGVALHLDVLTNGIVVTGTITASWRGECRRCLAPVGGVLRIPVQELYQTTVTDPDAFPIVGEQLDLTPMVREAVLLDLPTAPLCRDDCAGICPVCGADRNANPCSCDTTVRDDRWAALDALRRESR